MGSIMRARATSTGVIFGVVGGCASGMTCWLTYASYYPGGLSMATFVKNTGEELPMLVGNIVAIGVGAVFCIVVTFITRRKMTPEIEEAEWDKTRDIDNPLSPWVAKYKGELNLEDGENFHDRPPLEIVIRKFRAAKITAYCAAVLFTLLFICIWPGSMLSIDILDLTGFNIWTSISRVWAFTAAAFIIVVPMYQEVKAIIKQNAKNTKDRMMDEQNTAQGVVQPLQQNGSPTNTETGNINNGFQRNNKHDYIFQRLRNTLSRVVSISRASQ